jgi:cytoskeletal protein RodZ
MQGARESAGLSIDELSDRTSIRAGLLREIENNNFIHCGGDTYARGHLRNIAAIISVDAQTLIDLYNSEHSTEVRNIHDLLVENNVTKIPTERKTVSWKSLAIASIVVLAVIAGGQIIISNSKINEEIKSNQESRKNLEERIKNADLHINQVSVSIKTNNNKLVDCLESILNEKGSIILRLFFQFNSIFGIPYHLLMRRQKMFEIYKF